MEVLLIAEVCDCFTRTIRNRKTPVTSFEVTGVSFMVIRPVTGCR